MTVTASLAGAVMMLAYMARWAAMFGGLSKGRRDHAHAISLIAISIVAPMAAVIVQLAISRSREYVADRQGAYFAKDSLGLANALKRLGEASRIRPMKASVQTAHLFIVNPFHGGFVANLFSTHPPLEERIRRLHNIRS